MHDTPPPGFPAAVRSALANGPVRPVVETPRAGRPDPRPAAVLIPLFFDAGEWHVLLTERTQDLPEHQGQVAFPGGKRDPEDRDRVDTALRETWEEIGIPPERVEVLGLLSDFVTFTGYHVTPVVGIIPWPVDLTLSTRELDQVFTVPLRWLADPSHLTVETWDHPTLGPGTKVLFYYYGPHKIWGATARMLHDFLELIRPHLS